MCLECTDMKFKDALYIVDTDIDLQICMLILLDKPAAYVPPALRGKPQSSKPKLVSCRSSLMLVITLLHPTCAA